MKKFAACINALDQYLQLFHFSHLSKIDSHNLLVQTIDLGNKQIFSVIKSNNLHELIKLIKSTPFSIPFVRSKIDRCLNSILRQAGAKQYYFETFFARCNFLKSRDKARSPPKTVALASGKTRWKKTGTA